MRDYFRRAQRLSHLFVTGQQNFSGDNEPGWVYYVGAFVVPGRKHFAPARQPAKLIFY